MTVSFLSQAIEQQIPLENLTAQEVENVIFHLNQDLRRYGKVFKEKASEARRWIKTLSSTK